MSAIETKGLVHEYRTHLWSRAKRALQGLDLSVEAGEIFGYLGANGAGKTTTIKILVGLQTPKNGTATIFGDSVRDPESHRHIGFAPENPYFYEHLTARESMDFYGALCDVPRAERRTRGDELLAFVGMEAAADVRVREFSKGMRQRLGIAQALVHRPKLVILDEPMSGLDPVGRMQVREAILRLKDQGMTVFFSSHVLADVEMICDRVGMLQEGKLAACGPLHALLETREKEVEIGAADLPPDLAERLAADAASRLDRGETTLLRFPDRDAADRAVKAIVEGGGRLTLLRPTRETLEEYFMRSTGRSRAEVGGWSGGADR